MNAIMDQSIITATNVFQTPREIVVNNNFGPSPKDSLAWAYAFAAASIESVAIFDDQMRLLHCNNRFGNLDDACTADLKDLFSLFKYYERFYKNAAEGLNIISQVFLFRTPREFTLHNFSGWSCHCRAYPVMEETRRLGGVMLLAHKEDGSKTFSRGTLS